MQKNTKEETAQIIIDKAQVSVYRTAIFTDAVKELAVGESITITPDEWRSYFKNDPAAVLATWCREHAEYGGITTRQLKNNEGWIVMKTAMTHPNPRKSAKAINAEKHAKE